MKRLGTLLLFLLVGAAFTLAQQSQQSPADNSDRLVKATQNPVADLISVPFQNNLNYPIGSFVRNQNVLYTQPVYPVGIGQWNLITRAILPTIYQPEVNRPNGSRAGLGDLSLTLFLSPAKPGKVIWGIGPAFLIPTATASVLGAGKWGAGPSIVALVQPEHWTIGAVVNNVWSFAGQESRPKVNSFYMQYFVNYNLEKGWYITSSPILTSDWELPSNERWLVPFGGGVGRVFKIGSQSVSAQVQNFYNAIHPDTRPFPQWQLRMQFAFLFPQVK